MSLPIATQGVLGAGLALPVATEGLLVAAVERSRKRISGAVIEVTQSLRAMIEVR